MKIIAEYRSMELQQQINQLRNDLNDQPIFNNGQVTSSGTDPKSKTITTDSI